LSKGMRARPTHRTSTSSGWHPKASLLFVWTMITRI